MNYKVVLITNIPTPYRIPLFNELEKQLALNGIKLNVVFGALGYPRRKWAIDMTQCKFDHIVLETESIRFVDPEKSLFTYKGLIRTFMKEKPDLIITSGFSIATIKVWLFYWFQHTRYIIWSGAIHRKDQPDSIMRRLQRRMLIKRAAGFIAYGTMAKEYLVSLGADANKVKIAINTVDTEYYWRKSLEFRNHSTFLDEKRHLLYVGHSSPRKNVLKILKVIKKLTQHRSDFILDIVGDGEELGRLQEYVLDNQLGEFVEFHGSKQKSEIAIFLAMADCFLFQTDFDIWGLVLVEAMAAGLPSISSIHAGATQDLIEDGVTGFAMDFSETGKVAEKVDWLLENPDLAKEIGQNASRFITEHVSLEKSASGFVDAIRPALRL